jgi:uncharacterized short protein YbdD (DUF466 family)
MEHSKENIEQALRDYHEYKNYLQEMKNYQPRIKPKTFKEMFGYEIILLESGGFKLYGERYNDEK